MLLAVLVEAVEHGQVALAGHAEHGVDALRDQGLDQGMAGDSLRHGDPFIAKQAGLSAGGQAAFTRSRRRRCPQEL